MDGLVGRVQQSFRVRSIFDSCVRVVFLGLDRQSLGDGIYDPVNDDVLGPTSRLFTDYVHSYQLYNASIPHFDAGQRPGDAESADDADAIRDHRMGFCLNLCTHRIGGDEL